MSEGAITEDNDEGSPNLKNGYKITSDEGQR